jgi:hypothetical protein
MRRNDVFARDSEFLGQPQFFSFLLAAGASPSGSGRLAPMLSITAWSARSLWWKDWHGKTGGDYLTKLRTVPPPGARNWKAVGPVTEKKIAGHTFYEANAVASDTIPGSPQGFQADLAIVERGFVLRFIFEAGTKEELDRLLDSMSSLKL